MDEHPRHRSSPAGRNAVPLATPLFNLTLGMAHSGAWRCGLRTPPTKSINVQERAAKCRVLLGLLTATGRIGRYGLTACTDSARASTVAAYSLAAAACMMTVSAQTVGPSCTR